MRRHSFSSLEEAARKIAQDPKVSEAAAPTTAAAAGCNMRKRQLPIDAALANDANPAKKIALMSGGLTMEELLKNAPSMTPGAGGDQYLCLPGGEKYSWFFFFWSVLACDAYTDSLIMLHGYLRDGVCMRAVALVLLRAEELAAFSEKL